MNSNETAMQKPAIIEWVYAHEALVAGLMSLLAAFITIGVLIYLGCQEGRRWRQNRKNRLLAATAQLHLVQSVFNKYTAQTCQKYIRIVQGQQQQLDIDECPIGERQMGIIKECIEFGDDPADQEILRNLIMKFRYHQALLDYLEKFHSSNLFGSNPDNEPQSTLEAFIEENRALQFASERLSQLLNRDLR